MFVAAAVAATLIVSYRLTPIYESTATIDVDRRMPTGILGQEAMQSTTNDAVAAIGGISSTIGKMSEIAVTISSAIEEQGAATREIARNIQAAAEGSSEIAIGSEAPEATSFASGAGSPESS